MARKIELSRVLAAIDEARERFPFDTDLIPKKMKADLSAVLDCMEMVARLEAVNDRAGVREVLGYEDEEEGDDDDE